MKRIAFALCFLATSAFADDLTLAQQQKLIERSKPTVILNGKKVEAEVTSVTYCNAYTGHGYIVTKGSNGKIKKQPIVGCNGL